MKASKITANIKSLPLEYWMTCMGTGRYCPPLAECSPAYNMNGWYHDDRSKLSWFEYDGKAWVYDPKAFAYSYNLLDPPLKKTQSTEQYVQYVNPALKHFGTIILKHLLTKK